MRRRVIRAVAASAGLGLLWAVPQRNEAKSAPQPEVAVTVAATGTDGTVDMQLEAATTDQSARIVLRGVRIAPGGEASGAMCSTDRRLCMFARVNWPAQQAINSDLRIMRTGDVPLACTVEVTAPAVGEKTVATRVLQGPASLRTAHRALKLAPGEHSAQEVMNAITRDGQLALEIDANLVSCRVEVPPRVTIEEAIRLIVFSSGAAYVGVSESNVRLVDGTCDAEGVMEQE